MHLLRLPTNVLLYLFLFLTKRDLVSLSHTCVHLHHLYKVKSRKRLVSLPTDVLLHLFLFLPEEDLLSLSHTCVRLHTEMNDDRVWSRFITDEIRSLEELSPDNVLPELGLCTNRKHIMRKHRLWYNWRNTRVIKSAMNFDFSRSGDKVLMFYKNNYVLVLSGQFSELWDITGHSVSQYPLILPEEILELDRRSKLFMISERLVITYLSRVFVCQINIEDRSISLVYSFIPDEEVIVNPFLPRSDHASSTRGNWRYHEAGSHLACLESQESISHPTIHLWDILQGCKVGAFVAPFHGRFPSFHSCHGDELILQTRTDERGIRDSALIFTIATYFKFNIGKTRFFDLGFKAPFETFSRNEFPKAKEWLVCSKYCIQRKIETQHVLMRVTKRSTKVSVFSFESGEKLVERDFEHFQDEGYSLFDDKLIIFTDLKVLIVDVLSLETVYALPRGFSHCTVKPISVFGSNYLLVQEGREELRVWNIDNNNTTLVGQLSECDEIYVNNPGSKSISISSGRATVWHFW